MKPETSGPVEPLSAVQIQTLKRYEALLGERGLSLGLVSSSDRGRIWDRHIMDSLRVLPLLEAEHHSFLDMGSGAGFPGLPLAILRPGSLFSLIETRNLRASFLEMVVERLGLGNVNVVTGRVESVSAQVDVCLARAFASAPDCWRLAEPLLAPGGILIYWAGHSWLASDDASAAEAAAQLEIHGSGSPGRHGPLVMMRRKGPSPGR